MQISKLVVRLGIVMMAGVVSTSVSAGTGSSAKSSASSKGGDTTTAVCKNTNGGDRNDNTNPTIASNRPVVGKTKSNGAVR